MIQDLLAIVLLIQFAFIDSTTTLLGLSLFGGISEQNPVFKLVFKSLGVSVEVVIIAVILEMIAISFIYQLSLNSMAFTGVLIFLSLVGTKICVDDAILLRKCLL